MIRSLRLQRFLARYAILDRNIVHRHSDRTVQRQLRDPSFPLLVSFPRTGSHQLRLLMELYFQKPSLPRIFRYKRARSFTCCHVHDLIPPDRPAGIERKRVIYLYRDPVPTVHSILRYYEEDLKDLDRIAHWSRVYREHLKKWLLDEKGTEEKVLLYYEAFQQNPWDQFKDLCSFFGSKEDREAFETLFRTVTPDRISDHTTDTPAIIGKQKDRKNERESFERRSGHKVRELVFGKTPELRPFFSKRSDHHE